MRVLIVNTSEEENGYLSEAIHLCSMFLQEYEIEVEVLWLGRESLHPCTCCGKCLKRRKCLFGGVVNEIADRSDSFDGLIVGADVLFGEPAKQAVDFMNCLFRSTNEKYAGKVGAVILSSRKMNTEKAYQRLNQYYSASCMPVITGRYWNTCCENESEKGKEELKRLAENMQWVLKCIELGKQNGIVTNCVPDRLDEFMRGR